MKSEILINGKFAIQKLSHLINEKLAGQQILENVRLESIMMKGDDEWLYALMVVSGRYDGTVITKFKLRTSDSSPDLIIENLNVSLEGDGILTKMANRVLKVLVGARIESKVQALLHKSISTLMKEMTSKYGVMHVDEITLKADLADYNFEEISWNSTHLHCTFHASGILSVELG